MQKTQVTPEGRGLRRYRLRVGGAVATALIALVVAGCGSSTKSATPSSSNGGSSSSTTDGTGGGGASAVSAALKKFEAPLTSYSLPAASLKDVGGLKGKTIYYIPVANVVPEFTITAASLKQATAAVGAHLQVCSDPTGTPSAWSACANQAVSEHVAAIVLDAAPWQVLANELGKAQAQGIKVVIADQQPSTSFSARGKNAFMLGVSGTMQTAVADWVISDSGGKGQVLIIENTDGPSPPWFIKAFALPEFKQHAPNLKYTIQTISTANQQQLASDVSSDLVKNSDIGYIYTEFDQFLPNTLQGVQSAGATERVKGVSTTALLAGLQALKEKNFSYADAGQDYPYTAWAIADETYRLILGQPSVTENIPMRLFTRDNVSTVSLTTAAQDDGSWYGPTNYPSLFEKLWGVK